MTKQDKYRIAGDETNSFFVEAKINGVWTRITKDLGKGEAGHAKAKEIIETMEE